jgi:hypothetical protein
MPPVSLQTIALAFERNQQAVYAWVLVILGILIIIPALIGLL